ncbi:MAG: DNA-processing protein DprA [Candidatus Saccharibacteria bacterium]|nr:DNA-processing protein DprA [Candidatus Saccharibacteria bacterium]
MSTYFSHFSEKIKQISPLDNSFTEVLGSIALVPKILYFYGSLPGTNNAPKTGSNLNGYNDTSRPKAVAIVGSRKNTRYGEEVAYRLAYELAKKGVIIVSGLAHGIDSIAHRAALDAGGLTIAVLGTPIDKIYPKEHADLANEIVLHKGAVVSEYAPRTPEFLDAPLATDEAVKDGRRCLNFKTTFLYRNRLIAGLSDLVVVVEAAEHSGTLNTAAHALNQGKDVFAVPGNITNINSKGCNRLIAQGATPYTELNDVLRVLFPADFIKTRRKTLALPFGDTEDETLVLQSIASGENDGENIIKKLNFNAEKFNQIITLLEIKARVRPLGFNRWMLT